MPRHSTLNPNVAMSEMGVLNALCLLYKPRGSSKGVLLLTTSERCGHCGPM